MVLNIFPWWEMIESFSYIYWAFEYTVLWTGCSILQIFLFSCLFLIDVYWLVYFFLIGSLYLGYESFHGYTYYDYLLPLCKLPFHSHNGTFRGKVLSFNEVTIYQNIYIMVILFVSCLRTLWSLRCSPMFI